MIKTKLMLSGLIIFIAILLSFSMGNVVSILSYWFLSALLIYSVFRDKDIEKKNNHNLYLRIWVLILRIMTFYFILFKTQVIVQKVRLLE